MMCSDLLPDNCQTSKVRKQLLKYFIFGYKEGVGCEKYLTLNVQNENSLLTESADLKIFACLLLILQADAHDLLMRCLAFHTDPFIHVICEWSFLVCTCAMSHSSGFLTKLLIGMLWLMSMKSQRKWSRIFYYPPRSFKHIDYQGLNSRINQGQRLWV